MRMLATPFLAATLAATALLAPAAANPATTRTPNLEGTWTAPAGTGLFGFLHRFQLVAGGTIVQNVPTFLLTGGLTDWLSAGALYATQTDGRFALNHELEAYLAQRLLDEDAGAPLSLTVREAFHANYMSPDADVNLARRFGPLTLHGVARVLGRYRGATPRVSTGLGASWAFTPGLRVAADAAYAVVTPAFAGGAEPPVVWGAGLQLIVPNSPHTLSLQVSNAASASLHGAATASDALRWGFDFTVPFSGPRKAAEAPAKGPEGTTTAPESGKAAAFFASRCAGCHGAQGQGAFGPDLRKVEGQGDAAIATRIADGSAKGMPPFKAELSGAELQALVEYVKGL